MVYHKNDSILIHHGILGQKWGVRRYQNSDGTLTSEGKRHYSAEASKYQNRLNSADKRASRYVKKHDVADKKAFSNV